MVELDGGTVERWNGGTVERWNGASLNGAFHRALFPSARRSGPARPFLLFLFRRLLRARLTR